MRRSILFGLVFMALTGTAGAQEMTVDAIVSRANLASYYLCCTKRSTINSQTPKR